MRNDNYVSMQISKRAIDSTIAVYKNLKDKGLEDPNNMFFLIGWIAGVARANNTDIVLDENFIKDMNKELEKWGKTE